MAVTQNTYTGDGSTVLFSFTFPYLETTDIKVSLNGTVTTAYTLANATTVQFNSAPVNGAAIRIYRETDDSNLQATFYPGSAIRSSDLNDNFTQNLYVTQEANNVSAAATTTANTALTNSNTAISTANSAVSTANTASSNASAAVTTANTANTNASAAVSTANTASTNAAAAVSTSNAALTTAASAAYDAGTAITTANSAVSTANAATATANTASTAANNAVSTANTAATNASNAVTTANSAVTTAGNAVTTANSAVSTANSATSTANTALSTANAAASAVANAILYDTVANVAAIPASPANNDAVEVVDSTGIESFTPLSGVPTGFVGDSGLSVRLVYTTTGSTWNWIQYFPNDPEARYGDAITTLQIDLTAAEGDITTLQSDVLGLDNSKLALAGGTMTGTLTLAADPTADLQAATKQYVDNNLPPGTTVSDTAPSSPGAGDLWYDSVGGRLYVWYNDGNTGQWVDASPQGNRIAEFSAGSAGSPGLYVEGDTDTGIYSPGANQLAISTGGTARATVDSSGRLLVGTSSSSTTDTLVLQGNSSSSAGSAQLRLKRNETLTSGTGIGDISFGKASNTGAAVSAFADANWTDGSSHPSRLVFSTTADGASSPTERMRLTSNGAVVIGKTSADDTTAGFHFANTNYFSAVRSANPSLYINRLTNDGSLVEFAQDSTTEGTISVSGTTVSYNGAHLSRWSQLPSGAERTEILRGTVLSNIDEMCEWGDEDNEQLNRMKVSDIEGDKNVSGVFQAWDDDDDTYTNDFYCAMTGDFVIRIAAGTTVERGDLLMSAGDGTAKPQGDDIIRSKTIAKVTSTNVSCTYDDGSYCVPCVLMAC